jgi:cob(I)alamin adenosyltransferase
MVHLTKIYTKTGDDGTTSLANGTRTGKIHPRVYAIGAVDEANSAIGMCVEYRNAILDRIQNDLFDLGADIAGSTTVKITQERIEWLETTMDDLNQHLKPLDSFILPTGSLHNARTIVRRAEREVWMWLAYDAEGHATEDLNMLIPTYLNRLSDLLFIMARYYNSGNEKLWQPMKESNE